MHYDEMTPQERQLFEADRTFRRVAELLDNPVKGNFDAAHLKEINRRIFQDLPGAGFKDVTPGVFRSESQMYFKIRDIPSVNKSHYVAYSSMNQSDLDQLNTVLEGAGPENFKNLRPNEFAAKIGDLYADLDYIHPFSDGNSRTLRVFTGQIAIESGNTLNWEIFNKSQAGRDTLYIARDRSVIQRSLNYIKEEELLVKVVTSHYTLKEMRDLPSLVKDATVPMQSLKSEPPAPILTDYASGMPFKM
jgi:cell filamentation protein